jgi:threonine/homoserine/homoserine lactone efflux protein
MISSAFLLGLALLLATPGPTNTLLALAGATQPPDGTARFLLPRLLLAELAGYFAAVLLLGALMHAVGDGIELIRPALQAAAALYLALAAVRMWRARGEVSAGAAVAPRQILATTLLNPKTLIIALVLMPTGWSGQGAVAAAHLAAMALMIPLAGGAWFLGGRGLAKAAGSRLRRAIPRASAVLLGLFAMVLAGRALAGW